MKPVTILSAFIMMAVAFILSFVQTSVFAGLLGIESLTAVLVVSVLTMFITAPKGALFVGVNKEIWLPIVMENFYIVGAWLTRSVDFTAMVEYDKINLAEAGVDPDVLVNNTTYPIGITDREDAPNDLNLDTYDTENTVVRNVEEMETSYPKMKSVTRGHKLSLQEKFLLKVAHGWCPIANTANTPIIVTTGDDDGNGFKRMTFDDLDTLQFKFNKAKIPLNGRVLLLCAEHLRDLLKENRTLFNQSANTVEGSLARLSGFDIYVEEATPIFNKTTGVKVAFGAVAAPSTDTHASIAWCDSEVMRCDGSAKMFFEKDSPGERGDVIGFQARKLGLPLRAKGIAAIYSPAA